MFKIEEKDENNIKLFEKKSTKVEKIGLLSLLSFWDKNTWMIWKSKFMIKELIKQKDFSTLFTLKNENLLSVKEEVKLNKEINKALIDRTYKNKLSILRIMKEHKVEIKNENLFYFLISNYYFIMNDKLNNEEFKMKDEDRLIINEVQDKLKNNEFIQEFKKFIINDIKRSPNTIGAGMDWAMDRNAYYEPRKAKYLFGNMTKKELLEIINYDIGSVGVKNEYRALLNVAPIDYDVLNDLGLNIDDLIEKAKSEMIVKESKIEDELRGKLNNIVNKVNKIKEQNKEIYELELKLLIDKTLPKVIQKYVSIDEEYRETLKNIEGKTPKELFSDALQNIDINVSEIDLKMNEEKVKELSIENRKLKIL